ncbi:MAG: hypothetical protein AABX63_05180 [Nanoarchaeota archaeon]
MRTIPVYIESSQGHDTLNVPQNQLQKTIEGQLKDDKWATMEKKDGSTEILTKSDIPKQEQPAQNEPKEEKKDVNDEWKNSFSAVKGIETPSVNTSSSSPNKQWAKKFEKTKSATVTQKAKGG